MIVQVDVRDAEVLARLRHGSKRMIYAIANAANNTAKAVQVEAKRQLPQHFTLRSGRSFLERQVAVITFARPREGTIDARVAVDPRGRLLLAGFERGFERQPKVGKRVAVPTEARPSRASDIPAALFLKALALRRVGRVVRGAAGAYVAGHAVFQRIGRGVSRQLYGLAAPFRVKPRLGFLRMAESVVRRQFTAELRHQIKSTLEFKR